MRLTRSAIPILVVATYGLIAPGASAQTVARQTATVNSNAPIYIAAAVSPTPLRVAAPGTILRVVGEQGDWLQVEFNDPQWGPRVGWIQRSLVRVTSPELQPMDLSVREAPPAAAPPAPPQATSQVSFPGSEFSVGWAFVHVSADVLGTSVGSDIPLGWNSSSAWNLTPYVGIVLDVAGHYNLSIDDDPEFDAYTHSFSGGVRFALRKSQIVVPYVQFLVGYYRDDARYYDIHESSNNVGILPSGGVDIGGSKVAARIEFGWGKVFAEGIDTSHMRLVAGVVIRSGWRH